MDALVFMLTFAVIFTALGIALGIFTPEDKQ